MGAPLAVQERITDSRTIRRAVALMEELTGYHFRPRAAEATLPKLSVLGKAARSNHRSSTKSRAQIIEATKTVFPLPCSAVLPNPALHKPLRRYATCALGSGEWFRELAGQVSGWMTCVLNSPITV